MEDREGEGVDEVRLTDRFLLGEPQFRGFDIRGVGPRVVREFFDADGNVIIPEDDSNIIDDALGGRAYYLGRAELEIPLGSGASELGLRPSIWLDVGSLFNVTQPVLAEQSVRRSVARCGRQSDLHPGQRCRRDPGYRAVRARWYGEYAGDHPEHQFPRTLPW